MAISGEADVRLNVVSGIISFFSGTAVQASQGWGWNGDRRRRGTRWGRAS